MVSELHCPLIKERVEIEAKVSAPVPLRPFETLDSGFRQITMSLGVKQLIDLFCLGPYNLMDTEGSFERLAEGIVLTALWVDGMQNRLTGIDHQ